MMALLHVVVSVLTLLSVGRSAPITDCERLTKHLVIQGREQLLGTWTHIAETSNINETIFITKMFVDTVWGKLTAAEESDVIHLYQVQKIFDQCFAMTANLTLAHNTISMETPFNSSDVLLNTGCSDCLVFFQRQNIGGITHLGLQLLSKRKNISADELQEFKKQASCLDLQPPVVFKPQKGFCPDESSSLKPEAFNLNAVVASIDSNETNVLEKVYEKILERESIEEVFRRVLTVGSEWLDEMEKW